MSNQPNITVLLPAYNASKYLSEAIESILAQTYTNFEFLIINDGSSDNTIDIINSYKDDRIKVISRENKGLIATLNEGIDAASTEIIARMDADDVSFPNRLETQYNYLQQHTDLVLVGSEANVTDKDGSFLFILKPAGYTHQEIVNNIMTACPFNHPSVMFRKEAVIKAGYYPDKAITFEDHLLWKNLITIGNVANIQEVLLNYRLNPESVTMDERWRGKRFLELREKSLQNGYVTDDDFNELESIISSQNNSKYKQASYYATLAKKYLWDNPNNKLARQNLKESIKHYPNTTSYILYLFSYLPSGLRKTIYKLLKR